LKLLIKEFKELIINNNKIENESELTCKIKLIKQKYEKISTQLEIETENMLFNTMEESKALVVFEKETSLIKTIKEITKAIAKLAKVNVFERQNSGIKYGGKYE